MFISKQLLRFAAKSRGQILLVSLLELISIFCMTLISITSASVIQMLLGTKKIYFFKQIEYIFACMFLLIAIRFVISKIKTVQSIKCSVEIKSNLRYKLINKLFDLGPAYTASRRTGDIVTTIWSRVEWLNNYYSKYLPAALAGIANGIIIISIVLVIDWVTGVFMFVSIVGVLVSPIIFYGLMRNKGQEEWAENAKYYSDCLDGIQGISSLKSLNANKYQREKIHVQGEKLRKSIMKHLKVTIEENCTLEFFVRIGMSLTVVFATFRYLNGNVNEEMLIYVLFLATACFKPMFNMITAWHMGYRGITGAISIVELLDEDSVSLFAIDHTNKKRNLNDQKIDYGTIEFKKVKFSYNKNEKNAIDDVSFKIPNQTTTAIVGASGAGKSTIAHLLSGFYPVDEGMINVGGYNLNRENIVRIQNSIAAVWQDSYMFYGSFYDNILIGNPEATKEEVISVAKSANIHKMILDSENGYDTIIGERGLRLSGGERQRIAIARALLRDAPIIIFDEATASLDNKNEQQIQKSFKKLSSQRTTLIIAHRLETIKDSDQICIIDKGRIVAYGTHKELNGNSDAYQMIMGNQV